MKFTGRTKYRKWEKWKFERFIVFRLKSSFGQILEETQLQEPFLNCEEMHDTFQGTTFHVPTNDTGLRLNIITFASVSKMWRRETSERDRERRSRGTKKADSSVIMIHPARSALRLFICILISVVMLITRHCFLSRDVFVFHRFLSVFPRKIPSTKRNGGRRN